MRNNEIIIHTTDYAALEDLYTWLISEFEVTFVDTECEGVTLGSEDSAIKIVFEFVKNNWDKFISIVKNWLHNYNKDVVLVFENGEKKASFKCPSKRISDENMDQLISTLNGFFNTET